MLTTGQRMADGSVLARSEIFDIVPDSLTKVRLVMRRDTTGVEVIGNFDAETIYHDAAAGDKSLLSTSGRGYYVLGLVAPGHEPTVHALNDIALRSAEFEKWGGTMFLLSRDGVPPVDAAGLPANAVTGNDRGGAIATALEARDYPVFIIADTFNRVVYRIDGYVVNLGDRLVDVLSRL